MVFDFDGVIVDSEPIHLEGFRQVLAERGVSLGRDEYYERYLGFADREAFAAILQARGQGVSKPELRRLIEDKTRLVKQLLGNRTRALPGARELIASARDGGVPLAICSGALRAEIELAASAAGVRNAFSVIVSADDVTRGKPDPAGYRLALRLLGEVLGRAPDPARCVAIEDAPAGIDAAHGAGIRVLGVATSYPLVTLHAAERAVESLAEIALHDIVALAGGPGS